MAFLGIAPTGTVLPFAGSAAPEGWALCDGSAISRTTYSKLFGVISTTYGVGDNSTTFNVPDMRGVYPRGAGTNGTANYGGVTGHTPAGGALAAKGGQKTAKNGLANSGSNTVSGTAGGQTLGSTGVSLGSGSAASGGIDHTHNIGPLFRDSAFGDNNTPPRGSNSPVSGYTNTSGASAYLHGHTVSGSTDITHSHPSSSLTATAAAPTISGDSETTPAFLALNYIIKL